MLKKLLLALVVVVVLVVGVSFLLPSSYHVERSTVIEAPVAVVYDQVADLPKNEAWSPWGEQDPAMQVTYGDVTRGAGASYSWTSETMGSGTLRTAEAVENVSLVNDLDFGEMGVATGSWRFEAVGDSLSPATKATWALDGELDGIVGRYMGLFMDGMVGADFEKGLANLKRVSEAAAAEAPAEMPADAETPDATDVPADDAETPTVKASTDVE